MDTTNNISSKHKILYYNTGFDILYEKKLLKEWGLDDVEIISVDIPQLTLEMAVNMYNCDSSSANSAPNETIFDETTCDDTFCDIFGYLFNPAEIEACVVIYEKFTEKVFEKMPNLKLISMESIGYNNIDIEAAKRHGVMVSNMPGYCVEEVALHTVGLLLDLSRQITFLNNKVHEKIWNPFAGYEMHRLKDKTFGMVFFGEIPKRIVPMVKGLGMNILVYAPTKSQQYIESFGCQKADTLDELLISSDVVSLHCPLIENVTYHLIGEHELDLMKDSAFLINTSRGAVVDENALYIALSSGKIRAAAIDMFEKEKYINEDFLKLDNIIITPHSAFMSQDAIDECRIRGIDNIIRLLVNHKQPLNVVN